MTARTDYIAHCESLGIHRSLAGLMADAPGCVFSWRFTDSAMQLANSFLWDNSEQGHDFWKGVFLMLEQMGKTGECK